MGLVIRLIENDVGRVGYEFLEVIPAVEAMK